MSQGPAALIVGFTIQGLAVARSLTAAGIRVYAIERGLQSGNPFRTHPIALTNAATLIHANGLTGPDLVETLCDCRDLIPESEVVLFAASDNTVKELAKSWEKLQERYILSWAECRDQVANIIQKGSLPQYCEKADVNYPKTFVIDSDEDVESAASALRFPTLVKPNKPASSFKTNICATPESLHAFARNEHSNWPLVVQEWIDGPDDNLFSYTCFVDKGREVGGFSSRKVRSSPPGLGRATVVETSADTGVRDEARKLLAHLPVSGPVAMEFKRDANGTYWFIEANVGRTEFCVGLAIQAGLNLPLLEYRQACDIPLNAAGGHILPNVWYDTDKEPFCYLVPAARQRTLRPFGKSPTFPYFGQERPIVLVTAFIIAVKRIVARAVQKLRQIIRNWQAWAL